MAYNQYQQPLPPLPQHQQQQQYQPQFHQQQSYQQQQHQHQQQQQHPHAQSYPQTPVTPVDDFGDLGRGHPTGSARSSQYRIPSAPLMDQCTCQEITHPR